MKPGKRKFIWFAVVVTLLAAGIVIWRSAASFGPPQIITLSDGHQYRFAGADWGTNHPAPGILSHAVALLPDSWVIALERKLGSRSWMTYPVRTAPALGIWLEPTGTNSRVPFGTETILEIDATLADERGTRENSPAIELISSGIPERLFLQFALVPHRSRVLQCQIRELPVGGRGISRSDLGTFKFHNPLYRDYPQWKAEPMPAMKTAGDLQVRLNHLYRFPVQGDPSSYPCTYFALTLDSLRAESGKWTVAGVELSDATGDRVSQDYANPDGKDAYLVRGAFWPGEAALKLKLGLKRTSGFAPNELVIFTNLPPLRGSGFSAPPTNRFSITNLHDGLQVIIQNYHEILAWSGPAPGPWWVELQLPTRPPGVVADIVEVATDTGKVLTAPNSVESYPRTAINFHEMPADAKFLKVTVAVQKTRTVEFLAKPE